MAMKYLGESFDLHGGGEDLIFPHHECEIAQSEAVTRRPLARYWVHNGFVNLGAEKMSKSLGNTLLIRELVKRHAPDALRLWLLGTHYRNPVDFAEERLREAARALERFHRLLHDARRFGSAPAAATAAALPPEIAAFRGRFESAMDDDFNTPQALGVLFELSHALSEQRDEAVTDARARELLLSGVGELGRLARVLGLLERGVEVSGPPSEVERLVAERLQARARKDWKRSDELRDMIQRLGWAVEDTPSGPRVTRRSTGA
jgi:cysteinyl-tRNA synthetase